MIRTNICVYCSVLGDSTSLYETEDIFGNRYTLSRCNVCRTYFLAPNPSDEQLSGAYDDSYYGKHEQKFGYLAEKVLDRFRERRARSVSGYVGGKGALLDIGCGNGRFLQYMLRHGDFDLYGIELPGRSAQRAAKIPEIKLKIGTLEEGDYPDGFFDAITLFHVFEHLSCPADTLRTIVRILKRGGICVMSFPNIESIQSAIFKGKWLHLDPPRHLFHIAPDDFARIALDHGLVVERMDFMSIEQNPFGMIQSILNCTGTKREALFESIKGNMEYVGDVPKTTLMLQRVFMLTTFPLFIFSDMIESFLGKGATVRFVLRKN